MFPLKPVELSIFLEAGEILLPERFVKDDGDGITEIQGADGLIHRDPDAGAFIVHQDLFRDAGGLFAEHDEVVRAVFDFGIGLMRLGRGHENARAGVLLPEIFKAVVKEKPQVRPVIQTGAPEVFLIQREAKRPDQVECRSGRHAGPSDIPGITGNLRFMQYDVQTHLFPSFFKAWIPQEASYFMMQTGFKAELVRYCSCASTTRGV